MLKVFEVFLVPGADPDELLSAEQKKETSAQVMTLGEARAVGFGGLPDPGDKTVRLIAVNHNDGPWIHRILETSEIVASFREHDVD